MKKIRFTPLSEQEIRQNLIISIESLEKSLYTVGNEGIIDSMNHLINNAIPSTINKFVTFTSALTKNFFTLNFKEKFLNLKEFLFGNEVRKMVKAFNNISYMDIKNKEMYIPMDFKGDLNAYIQLLNDCTKRYPILLDNMDILTVYANTIISNKGKGVGPIKDMQEKNNGIVDNYKKQIQKYFKGKGEIITIGEQFKRNGDICIAIEEVNKINDFLNKIDYTSLNKKITALSVILKTLEGNIKSKKITSLTPAEVSSLGLGIIDIAKEAEFFSSIVYSTLLVRGCLIDTYRLIFDK